MKDSTLRKGHLNFPRKTNVCPNDWNPVNGREQEVKTLMSGQQALQRTSRHREKPETLV